MLKKRFLLLVVFCLSIRSVWAVSAYPGLINFRQPDGSYVKVRMMGDERFHWAESEDGYTLLSDRAGFLTLAMPDKEGNLLATEYRMVNIHERTLRIKDAMRMVQPHARFKPQQLEQPVMKSKQAASMRKVIHNDQPVTGTRKYLVILMEFADRKFQKTAEEFNRLLNEVGYREGGNSGSVHDFYTENSYGQLDLQCDLAGIYTASETMAYYGNNTNGAASQLAVEALTAASQQFNLSDYDCNGDGIIDGVHIIFAGYGEEAGGGDDCIWSHESTTSGYFCQIGTIRMNAYSCTPELSGNQGTTMSKIGVICHEIGHALGTMDFYDTNYADGGSYGGSGQWDVMGSGNWNNGGATPAHFNPYSKIYDFKWTDYRDGNKPQSVMLEAKKKGEFMRIDTKTEGEFFLLEYRQKTGFDASIPGHGLMIWRASEGMSAVSSNTINAYHKQQFYPVAANATAQIPTSSPDSYGTTNSNSTPFPGTLNKTMFTDETTPSMKDWAGNDTGLPVTDIVEDQPGGTVSFLIAGGSGQAYGLTVAERTYNSLTLSWKNDESRKVIVIGNTEDAFGAPTSKDYAAGESISGGGTVLYAGTGTTFQHTGLTDGMHYYYKMYTLQTNGTDWGAPIKVTGRTMVQGIRSFPYREDFEQCRLEDDSWEQEFIAGQNPWLVQPAWGATTNVLYFNWQFGKGDRQCTRIIMPPIDFSGHSNATLEFDYRNTLINMEVIYRTSATGEWKPLYTMNNHYKTGMTNLMAYESEEHAAVLLPELSDSYQIAFIGDFSWRGNTFSSAELGTIDNILIMVDRTALVGTGGVVDVGTTWCEVGVSFGNGMEQLSAQGIEWSTNQTDWTAIDAAIDARKVRIEGLTINTSYYYRAFGVTASGRIYGEVKSFTTDSKDSQDGLNFVINADNTITITGISNTFSGTEIKVPGTMTVNGNVYPVTAIGAFAFARVSNIKTITLSEGLKAIGEEAFNELNGVRELHIPASVEDICGSETKHLGAMKALAVLTVADGNTKYCAVDNVLYTKDMKTLVKYAAAATRDTYVIPEGVTAIMSQAFRSCSVKEIVLPSTMQQIARLAFDNPYGLQCITSHAIAPPKVLPSGNVLYMSSYYDLYVHHHAYNAYKNDAVWSNLKSINEIQHTLGDVNDDGQVDVTDAACIVNDRLGQSSTGFLQVCSDINNDGMLNMSDADAVVDIMYGSGSVSQTLQTASASGNLAAPDVTLVDYGEGTVSVCLANASGKIMAAQFILRLPTGITPVMNGENIVMADGAGLSGDCLLRGRRMADGRYLIVYLSKSRNQLSSPELCTFKVFKTSIADGRYSASLSDIRITDFSGNGKVLEDTSFGIKVESYYDLVYMVDGAKYKTVRLLLGAGIVPEEGPAKIGHTFAGWDGILAVMPNHDVTVTARYTVNKYTITFDTDGGSTVEAITQDYNSAVTPPANPVKTGYTFTGWTPALPQTIPAEDITVKAIWQINQYKVTFMVDDVVVKEDMLDYGAQIIAPDDPEKEGYHFVGWTPEIDAVVPDHDVTYTAVFEVVDDAITDIVADDNSVFGIYNANGMLIKANANSDDYRNLPAGIYIIRGKKIVKK